MKMQFYFLKKLSSYSFLQWKSDFYVIFQAYLENSDSLTGILNFKFPMKALLIISEVALFLKIWIFKFCGAYQFSHAILSKHSLLSQK